MSDSTLRADLNLVARRVVALEKLSNERHIIQLTIRKAAKGLAQAEEAWRTVVAQRKVAAYARITAASKLPKDDAGNRKRGQLYMKFEKAWQRKLDKATAALDKARHHLYMTILDVPLK